MSRAAASGVAGIDVAVIGGGVIGASIAYHLARAGARALLVERGTRPAASPGATWASAGGLRAQGRHPAEQPLARLAAARWPSLEAELDAWLEVEFGGHLHLAETEAECDLLRARIAADRAGGIAVEWVEGDRLRDLAPHVMPALAGAYSEGDGQAHPGRTAAGFVRAGERHGLVCRTATEARLHVTADRVAGIRLADGTLIASETVVLATGAWSVALLGELGIGLPLRWRGLQMLLSDVAPPLLCPTVTAIGRNLSLKQSPSGQMMAGGGWLSPARAEVRAVPREADILPHWRTAVTVLPAMGALSLAQSWAGAEAQTPDGIPVIGRLGPPGLYAAFGFCGHGFQISPAIGELVARELTGEAQTLLAPFRASRFAAVTSAAAAAFAAEPVPGQAADPPAAPEPATR
jgi:sarcosine oxidase subunit beta